MSDIVPKEEKLNVQRGRVGRPTMLDLNKAYGVLQAISQTGSIEGAAALSGISATTYYNWLRHGRRMAEREAEGHRIDPEDQPFASLYRNVSETLAHLEVRNFEIVQHAAREGVWQAAAWILERRFPARWGRRGQGDKSAVSISTDRVTVAPAGENSSSKPEPGEPGEARLDM